MTIQILLTLGLLLILWYVVIERSSSRLLSVVIGCCALPGIYFIWEPDQSTYIAHVLGVGRGTDLLLYTWILISLFLVVKLHIKLRVQLSMITQLTRAIALADLEIKQSQ